MNRRLPWLVGVLLLWAWWLSAAWALSLPSHFDPEAMKTALKVIEKGADQATRERAAGYLMRYHKQFQNMAFSGDIPDSLFQKGQEVFKSLNDDLIRQAAKENGLEVVVQKAKPGATRYKPYTDTDIIVRRADGRPITLEDVKRLENSYLDKVRTRTGGNASMESTLTDFMPDPQYTSPKEFQRINEYINSRGGAAYERPNSALVEKTFRTGGKQAVGKLGPRATTDYVLDNLKLGRRFLNEARMLENSARMIRNSNPKAAKDLLIEAQSRRALAAKYMDRINTTTEILEQTYGGAASGTKGKGFDRFIQKLVKERGVASQLENAAFGSVDDLVMNKVIRDYTQALLKTSSKDPATAGRMLNEMSEWVVRNLTPAQQGELIEQALAMGEKRVAKDLAAALRKANARLKLERMGVQSEGAGAVRGAKAAERLALVIGGLFAVYQTSQAEAADKPQTALDEGLGFLGGLAAASAAGALSGSVVPLGGTVVGFVVGAGAYIAGDLIGRMAAGRIGTALGINPRAHLSVVAEAADRVYRGLKARGVPEALAKTAARLLAEGKMERFRKLMAAIREGKATGLYITAVRLVRDWYCTNRPVIQSAASLPDLIQEEIDRKNKWRRMFGLKPIESLGP